jgi:putative heme iron utilization protein
MDTSTLQSLAGLIRAGRAAALATLHDGAPLVTLVVYAYRPDFSGFILHLSRLAPHTQALLADRRAALMIAEPEAAGRDPQLLRRLSLQGQAAPLGRDAPDYAAVRALYLERFPAAGPMFGLGDFDLYEFKAVAGRFVAGFGQAYNLEPGHLRRAAHS